MTPNNRAGGGGGIPRLPHSGCARPAAPHQERYAEKPIEDSMKAFRAYSLCCFLLAGPIVSGCATYRHTSANPKISEEDPNRPSLWDHVVDYAVMPFAFVFYNLRVLVGAEDGSNYNGPQFFR